VVVLVLTLGCSSTDPSVRPSSEPSPSPAPSLPSPSPIPSPEPSVDRNVVAGLFKLDDKSLYITCSGLGSPTVVYFHPYVTDRAFSGIAGAIPLVERLRERTRTCLYDRANVGQSGFADGPLTGETSVADLHALLELAGEQGPFVLLGSSFGGLIAYQYAITHPDEVAGMVLLDPSLPDEQTRIAEAVLPPEFQLPANEWRASVEQLDRPTTYDQAEALIGEEPEIPVTIMASNDLGIPADLPADEIIRLTRQLQREFVDRFASGEVVLVDSPGFIEQAIPERVVEEVGRLIERLPS
jgi:pimeloyl-ACP methyl ester carboxylesterase